jgi:hypothetical protein
VERIRVFGVYEVLGEFLSVGVSSPENDLVGSHGVPEVLNLLPTLRSEGNVEKVFGHDPSMP